MSAGIACAVPAPYPVTINSRAQTAPPIVVYRGNESVYRLSFTDGDIASTISAGEVPFMAWATNNSAAVNSTSSYAIVSGSTGVVDFTFSPESVNFAPGAYIYETGVKSVTGNNRVYRQGKFQIYGSPVGSGVASVTWTTNLNWAAFTWQNLPVWLLASNTNGWQVGAHSAWLTNETDAIALDALATNQVIRLHDSQTATKFQTVENGTGTVWLVSPATNYTVTLSADFIETVTSTRPAWTNHVWPFADGGWVGVDAGVDPASLDYGVGPSAWRAEEGATYPFVLSPVQNAQGTAVVSQLVYSVTNVLSTYATAARVAAVEADVAAIALTTNSVTLDPYSKTLYGDLATTNTAGYAGFLTTNAAVAHLVTSSTDIGTSLGKFRYDIACRTYGSVSFSGWALAAAGAVTNQSAYVRVTAYTEEGSAIVSNVGPTVVVVNAAYSNLTASLQLPYPLTNGYFVAEAFSATNSSFGIRLSTGGSYPTTLAMNVKPLNYATIAETDYKLDSHVTGGVHTNVTLAGTVLTNGVSIFGGWSNSIPTVTLRYGTTNFNILLVAP